MLNTAGYQNFAKLVMSPVQVLPLFLEIIIDVLGYTGSVNKNNTVKFLVWTDEWMNCNLTAFLTVFQSYQSDGRVILKDCM